MASMKVRASISATQASYIPLATFSSPSEMSLCWKANWTKADEVHTYSTHMTHFIPKVQHISKCHRWLNLQCLHAPPHSPQHMPCTEFWGQPTHCQFLQCINESDNKHCIPVQCMYVVTPYVRTYVRMYLLHAPLAPVHLYLVQCVVH